MPQGFSLPIAVAILNFLIFLCALILLGGAAMPIKTIDGRYLLWGTGGISHYMPFKHYFEISKASYLYVTVHGISSVCLLAIAILMDFLLPLIRRYRA